MNFIKLTLTGFVLGITSIIPGISTATMAVVFNVYDRLINIIVPNVKKVLAAWLFWLPLVIGGVGGVIFASITITKLLEHYNIPTYWFLIGVIAGSIPAIYSRVLHPQLSDSNSQTTSEHSQPKPCCKAASFLPSLSSAISAIIALSLMILMVLFRPEEGVTVYTELTPPLFGILVLVGVLGAVSMIVPGISGAFVLLVIGFYATITKAVPLNIPILIPFGIGACAGILLGAAFVRILLAKAPRITHGAVLGLVAGSIFVLYHRMDSPGGFGEGIVIVISIICLLAGFTISFLMGRKKRKTNSTVAEIKTT